MSTQPYTNIQMFTVETQDGTLYVMEAMSQRTRYGFRHVIDIHAPFNARVKTCYYNRTWERFTYESTLRKAIEKCPEKHRQELRDILIERRGQRLSEEADAFFADFRQTFESLSPRGKEIIANSPPLKNMEDAKTQIAIMKSMKLAGL